jgi:hypothetical protein
MAVPGPPVFDAETREQISSARRTVEYHLHKVFTKTRSNSRSPLRGGSRAPSAQLDGEAERIGTFVALEPVLTVE